VGGPSSPTLTVGAGVTIAFAPGFGIQVGTSGIGNGGLVVQGTVGTGPECAPVVFTTDVGVAPIPGDWGELHFGSGTLATTNITNLILEYAGGSDNSDPSEFASLFVDGYLGDFTVPLSNVTASNNAAAGMVFVGDHTGPSSASSGTLTVTDWLPDQDPFRIFPDATWMLSFVKVSTADAKNGFVHTTGTGGAGTTVDVTQTWPSIEPLAYVLGEESDTFTSLYVDGAGGAAATLTIAAPNTLRLGNGFVIYVDESGSGLGGLQANASASQPITFTSLSGVPEPGAWGGILFSGYGTTLSSVSGVTIDSAGSGAGNIVTGCTMTGNTVGAIGIFANADGICVPAPTLENITFSSLPPGVWGVLGLSQDPTTITSLATMDGNVFPSTSTAVFDCPFGESGPMGNWQCSY
jgi:hypothetical protein